MVSTTVNCLAGLSLRSTIFYCLSVSTLRRPINDRCTRALSVPRFLYHRFRFRIRIRPPQIRSINGKVHECLSPDLQWHMLALMSSVLTLLSRLPALMRHSYTIGEFQITSRCLCNNTRPSRRILQTDYQALQQRSKRSRKVVGPLTLLPSRLRPLCLSLPFYHGCSTSLAVDTYQSGIIDSHHACRYFTATAVARRRSTSTS